MLPLLPLWPVPEGRSAWRTLSKAYLEFLDAAPAVLARLCRWRPVGADGRTSVTLGPILWAHRRLWRR